MNKTQKIVRLLFYSEAGMSSAQMKAHGIQNPSAMIFLLKNRYDVNVQDYRPDENKTSKLFYVPPTHENIRAIKTNIDPLFRVEHKDRNKFKMRVYSAICGMISGFVLGNIIWNLFIK